MARLSAGCEAFARLARTLLEGRHGLAFVSSGDNAWRECRVFFRNATTGVEVVWDYAVDVRFGPLVEGALASASGATRGLPFPAHYLSALAELRAPGRAVGLYDTSASREVTWKNLEGALRAAVDALFELAGDVVDGDFSVFPQLDEAAWARGERSGAAEPTT